ncbi:MAG TPA: 7-carboxy-7-deazaguanine synthase [Haliscomenobacter sp.]|nr:7-carboxy-7-deazaguanine synthase [Haliscomenobacter sp.]
MTTYKIKEIFYTLQGEGAQSGRPAVFCRFSGCNLWSGREEDRSKAICQFCDTDFWGMDGENGGKYNAEELADKVISLWPGGSEKRKANSEKRKAKSEKQVGEILDLAGKPYVVCTGGEPLLQLDEPLIEAFHRRGLEVAVETNGTIAAPAGLDWICMSPKANTELLIQSGHELKLVYPQAGAEPERYEQLDFEHFYLQPMDGPLAQQNTRLTLEYCLSHPQWSLSLQTHKILGIA